MLIAMAHGNGHGNEGSMITYLNSYCITSMFRPERETSLALCVNATPTSTTDLRSKWKRTI